MNQMDTPVPPELLDLLRFMCQTWAKIDEWAYAHVEPDSLIHYPVVQGTRNQIDLRRIGEQNYDVTNIRKAVDWILKQETAKRPEFSYFDFKPEIATDIDRASGECRWTLEETDWYSMWNGECGAVWSLEVGGPTENKMAYCPQCGRPLVEVAEDEEE